MSATARRMHWTEEEYLAFENNSPTKHEYLEGEIFAMAGAKPSHNQIASNTLVALGTLLRGQHCRTFNSDQRIYVPQTGLYTYADGGVACGRWQIHTDGMCLLNPILLYEVLSSSTRDYDRGTKREHYQQISSLGHLLLIDQPTHLVEYYHRDPGGPWDCTTAQAGAIHLPELGGSILLEDLYLLDEDT
jgi:Uma2 family endonuclease